MILCVKYLGKISEITLVDENEITIETVMPVLEFKKLLETTYDQLSNESYKIALNQELVEDDYLITEDCEIAILPPFAGG